METDVWQEMKSSHSIRWFAVIITGMVVIVFLWWFFGGFGFWQLPGLAILMAGIAEILYILYKISTGRKSTLVHVGLPLLFIGIACYLSFAGHVLLGTLQIMSLVLIVIGIVLLPIGVISSRKA
jgi:hypothetical protein